MPELIGILIAEEGYGARRVQMDMKGVGKKPHLLGLLRLAVVEDDQISISHIEA